MDHHRSGMGELYSGKMQGSQQLNRWQDGLVGSNQEDIIDDNNGYTDVCHYLDV